MKRLPTIFFTACALFFACSPGDRIAGSKGGSETTNGITACVYRPDGVPAAGSIVRLRRSDYVSRTDALSTMAPDRSDAATDDQGRFSIATIEPGAYCIEVKVKFYRAIEQKRRRFYESNC